MKPDPKEIVRVKMIADDKAAPEGHTVIEYAEGQEYDVPAFVAEAFLEAGTAEQIGGEDASKVVARRKAKEKKDAE